MARADQLLALARAGSYGDRPAFRKALEEIIASERARQHHVLADRLATHLDGADRPDRVLGPTRRAGVTDLYHEIAPARTLDDLVLPKDVVAACRQLLAEHQRTDLLRAHNLEPRHRLLLTGPPGNGKTSLAEALAAELAVPLLSVRYESVIASYLGETSVRLAKLFEQVRTHRCVLFFDEFDVVGKERGDIHETGEIKRVVSSLLLQVDELPSHVVVVAATNHPELLDRAVWRRFQIRIDLPPPTQSLAEEWFRRFEKRNGLQLGRAPTTLAKQLRRLSFSELEQFGLDVQRQHVLGLPDCDMKAIVAAQLKLWRGRSERRGAGAGNGGHQDARTAPSGSP